MPTENLLKEKVDGSKQTEAKPITPKERSTPLKFNEDVIKKIPLVMIFNKMDKERKGAR
jgi:hypothetical protein